MVQLEPQQLAGLAAFDARCVDAEAAVLVAHNDESGSLAERWRRIAAAEREMAAVYRAAREHVSISSVVWSALWDAERSWVQKAEQSEQDATEFELVGVQRAEQDERDAGA